MSYDISDTGASIRFVNDGGFFYLMKHSIKAITAVRGDLIKVDTGCCLNSIFIYASQVTEPNNSGPDNLSNILNNWITDFIANPAGGNGEEGSGPR